MSREPRLEPKQTTLPNEIAAEPAENWSSLHDAAARGDENLLQSVILGMVDIAVKELKYGNSPLHEAASKGFSRGVKILCTSKERHYKDKSSSRYCILNMQNYAGFTALHLAAQNGHNQSCRELLLAGADPDIANYYGDTALHTACRYGHAGAARILLSAFCNVNKGNLNGDTPLHITCAMGRHKLTRIMLEAECEINVKNAQGETPRDIAIRKGYTKIVEILNSPHRMRNKASGKHQGDENVASKSILFDPKCKAVLKDVSWSPYGCHYFPDPRAFPSPKLETLPKEPLKKGEQYYLDLAGHIRKGPIGIGNICYCGPFFKHIENKINSNKKQLKKYVHNAKEDLGDKVQALAERTNEQIEKLTRSMIADRIQCENRRRYLENCLTRGDPLRLTTEYIPKLKHIQKIDSKVLKRSQSLEFLGEEGNSQNGLANCRSYDVLDHYADETASYVPEKNTAPTSRNISKNEFHNIMRAKTLFESVVSNATQVPSIHLYSQNTDEDGQGRGEVIEAESPVPTMQLKKHATRNNNILGAKLLETRQTKLENQSHDLPDFRTNNSLDYLYDVKKKEFILQNVICALRKDHKAARSKGERTLNESECNQGDKLRYKDENSLVNSNGFFKTGDRVVSQIPPKAAASSSHELMMSDLNYQQRNSALNDTRNVLKYSKNTPPMNFSSQQMPSNSTRNDEYLARLNKLQIDNDLIQSTPFYIEDNSLQLSIEHHNTQSLSSPHSSTSAGLPSPNSVLYPNKHTSTIMKFQHIVPKDAFFHDLSHRKNAPSEKSKNKHEILGSADNQMLSFSHLKKYPATHSSHECKTNSLLVVPVQVTQQSSFANAVNGKAMSTTHGIGHIKHLDYANDGISSSRTFSPNEALLSNQNVEPRSYRANEEPVNGGNAGIVEFHTNNISSLV